MTIPEGESKNFRNLKKCEESKEKTGISGILKLIITILKKFEFYTRAPKVIQYT